MKSIAMRLLILIAAATSLMAYAQDTIKVRVETVQVYANVTDFKGRFVTGLKQGDFKVFEDGTPQNVDAFSSDDSPLSVGLIFDVNDTMADNFPLARQAALTFLNAGNLGNEYFIVEFNNKAQITQEYTHDLEKLAHHVPVLHRTKDSAALDAMNLALDVLRHGSNPRKVLLVFTNGGYSKNEHNAGQIQNLARQLDAQIFGAAMVMPSVPVENGDPMACASPTPGVCGVYAFSSHYDNGGNIISSVGGEGFSADSGSDFVTACRRISVALRNQYILGYQPTNPEHDGKYRHLEVKLVVRDVPDLKVHTRDGYYAFAPASGRF